MSTSVEIINLCDEDDTTLTNNRRTLAANSRRVSALGSSRSKRSARDDVETIDIVEDVEIVASTVQPVPRLRKKPCLLDVRKSKTIALQAPNVVSHPIQPDSEPSGPKCGICFEVFGGDTGRPLWAGPCGHVYCKDCLIECVKKTKKCPKCRKSLQARQLHQVYLDL